MTKNDLYGVKDKWARSAKPVEGSDQAGTRNLFHGLSATSSMRHVVETRKKSQMRKNRLGNLAERTWSCEWPSITTLFSQLPSSTVQICSRGKSAKGVRERSPSSNCGANLCTWSHS